MTQFSEVFCYFFLGPNTFKTPLPTPLAHVILTIALLYCTFQYTVYETHYL